MQVSNTLKALINLLIAFQRKYRRLNPVLACRRHVQTVSWAERNMMAHSIVFSALLNVALLGQSRLMFL